MLTHRITQKELTQWCSIPWQELTKRDDLHAALEIRDDRATLMAEIGNLMAEELIDHNRRGISTKWVLPAGPCDEYDAFVERINREHISCRDLYVFHMDEFLDWEGRPFEVDDTYESLEGTMLACFYNRIDPDLRPDEDHRIWPRITDLDAADDLCKKLGGIDTVFAGVGATGLVAFNEAPRSYWIRPTVEEYAQSRTRIVTLNEDSMLAMAQRSFGCCLERIPPMAITLGFRVMCSAARLVCMVATGDWKQTVCRVLLLSDPTTEYPVTILTNHIPRTILYVDKQTIDHPMSHVTRGW